MKGTVAVAYLFPEQHGVTANFHVSLMQLLAHDASRNRRVLGGGTHMALPCASGRLAEGRNELTKGFLDSGCEWLWMVDADMGFEPTVIDRLVDAADPKKAPIVGGLCFAYGAESKGPYADPRYRVFPTIYRFVEQGDQVGFAVIDEYPHNKMIQVSGTGAACLLIHRSAVEKITDEYGPEWWTPLPHPTGPVFSEDLSFCVRAQGVSLPVHVHTGIQCSHAKTVFLSERHNKTLL